MQNKKQSSRIPGILTNNDAEIFDTPQGIVNAFATYFESVYLQPSDDDNTSWNECQNDIMVNISEIKESDVLLAMKRLKPTLSQGADGIPGFFVKDCSNCLAQPLVLLFNLAIKTNKFPDMWKTGKVCPIFKNGSRTRITNYRPITIPSSFSKVFEIVIHTQIYASVQRVICEEQHGFVKNRSTTTNLVCLTQYLCEAIDANEQVDVIYTDFSKAFDKIDHSVTLHKLKQIGFSNNLLAFFKSYLTNRFQYVEYMGYQSNKYCSTSGVPQGSVLGPLLFVIFINDISSLLSVQSLLYADDMKIFSKINSIEDCIELQENINILSRWCDLNKLTLNVGKCKVLSFSRKRHPIMFDYNIQLTTLEKPDSIKDLGIVFDTKLSFSLHYEYITTSALKSLGFILRSCKDFNNLECLKVLYYAYVRSRLEYASVTWSPYYAKYKIELESVQRKFAKFLYLKQNGYYPRQGFCHTQLLEIFNICALECRRAIYSAKFLYNILNNNIDCSFLLAMLRLNAPQVISRNYRIFYLPFARTNVMLKSPIYIMCKIGNILHGQLDIFLVKQANIIKFIISNFELF